ncbi:MAG: BlaI/MecI/CopY family transcriptional regulator [Bacteroidaceae bacterium]|nr:BlaI/MecI/CopY family transcriptional regulator [Bacteroidaceae bacterium]
MKKLTDKELKIMDVLWDNGPLSTRDIILHLPDITTHFNTIATYVRRLEQHGMIGHEELSPRFYLYHATVTREQYISYVNKESIDRFFDGSYMDFISRLVKRHEVSIDELKELIRMVEEE